MVFLVVFFLSVFLYLLYKFFYSSLSGTFLVTGIENIRIFLLNIFSFVHTEMSLFSPTSISLIGLFFVMFFGGLFFLMIPVEISFFGALTNFSPVTVLIVTALGAGLSYTLDYFIGRRFSGISRKVISLKKFYKTKSVVNRYGGWAVLFFNIIGIGSQQTTFILGVFRYNRVRLAFLTATGQLIKYSVIILFFYLS